MLNVAWAYFIFIFRYLQNMEAVYELEHWCVRTVVVTFFLGWYLESCSTDFKNKELVLTNTCVVDGASNQIGNAMDVYVLFLFSYLVSLHYCVDVKQNNRIQLVLLVY